MGGQLMAHTVYLSSAYLAPVSYYAKLTRYDNAVIEQYDHYTKQTYRNRCRIASPTGVLELTIPVVRTGQKTLMRDVRISEHGHWRRLHWNALESAYGNTPFFMYYADDFRTLYDRHTEFLMDFNEELCRLVCSLIDIHPHLSRTETYETNLSTDNADFREAIHPKKAFCEADPSFIPRPYYQVFEHRHGFLPDLSIVDLLFNMGTESALYLSP
ncbi:MAG: WbqC family protein [Prevotellaceae bacterium]|jgi:hypothetical protein|nr:WbqC family protein [Prevotellaceae bacterium]